MNSELYSRLEILSARRKSKKKSKPAVKAKGAQEHLQILYMLIAARYLEQESAIRKNFDQLTRWYNKAASFLDLYDIPKRPYRIILRLIKAKKVDTSEFDQILDDIVDNLRPNMRQIRSNLGLTDNQIMAYNSGYRMLNKPTERNLENAIRAVGLINSSEHNEWFTETIEGQQDIIEELTFLVHKLIKKKRPTLTIEEAQKIREQKPARYKQYLALRRQAIVQYRKALRSMVRSSGEPQIDARKTRKALEASGVLVHGIPKGFVGGIDEAGKLYTSAGKQLRQQPPQNAKVVMNPKYDAKSDNGYYLKYQIPGTAGKNQYAFTVDWNQQQTKVRDAKVMGLTNEVDKARKKWVIDLKGKDPTKRLLGVMVELLYTFQIRSGSARNQTAGKQTFGLSTLQGKHLNKRGNNLVIKYPGKSGVPQLHKILPRGTINKLIIKQLTNLKQQKDADEYLFYDPKRKRRITSGQLNQYIRTLGLALTAKDFRRLQGKVLMEKYFKENPLPKEATQTQVSTYLKAGALQVGKALGHKRGVKLAGKKTSFTSSTAINSYIPPVILKGLYQDRGLRIPKFLTTKFG